MQPFKLVFKDVKAFNSSSEMEDYYVTTSRNVTFAGIQFDDSLLNGHDLGSDKNVNFALRYVFVYFIKIKKLRIYFLIKYSFPSELRFSNSLLEQNNWHTNLIYPLFQIAGPRNPGSTSGATPSECFPINNIFVQVNII